MIANYECKFFPLKLVLCNIVRVQVVYKTLVCRRHVLFEPAEFYDVSPRGIMKEFKFESR